MQLTVTAFLGLLRRNFPEVSSVSTHVFLPTLEGPAANSSSCTPACAHAIDFPLAPPPRCNEVPPRRGNFCASKRQCVCNQIGFHFCTLCYGPPARAQSMSVMSSTDCTDTHVRVRLGRIPRAQEFQMPLEEEEE